MSNTACILTDSSAQFSQPVFPGSDLIRIVNFHIKTNYHNDSNRQEIKPADLPGRWPNDQSLVIEPPSTEEFYNLIFGLTAKFNEVFVILSSSGLSSGFSNASEACQVLQGRSSIRLFDSQSISSGLGSLVQFAAQLIHSGKSFANIEKLLRLQIPKTYALICPSTLSYLQVSNYVDEAQAVVNDLLGISPIFTLEEGRLSALEKSKTIHHLVEYFIEFIGEFENLMNISLIQPNPPQGFDTREIRSFVEEMHPNAQLSEHPINMPLAAMLGPKTSGLFLLEKA